MISSLSQSAQRLIGKLGLGRSILPAPRRTRTTLTPEERQQQQRLGAQAFARLQQAAAENTSHSIPNLSPGDLAVRRVTDNGILYTVHVVLSRQGGENKYPVARFDIDVSNNRVLTCHSPHRQEVVGTLDEFEERLNGSCEFVRTWRLYPTMNSKE